MAPTLRIDCVRREKGVMAGRGGLDQGEDGGEGRILRPMGDIGHLALWRAACSVPHLEQTSLEYKTLSQAPES